MTRQNFAALFDIKSQRPVRTFSGIQATWSRGQIAVSPDGAYVCSGSEDGTMSVQPVVRRVRRPWWRPHAVVMDCVCLCLCLSLVCRRQESVGGQHRQRRPFGGRGRPSLRIHHPHVWRRMAPDAGHRSNVQCRGCVPHHVVLSCKRCVSKRAPPAVFAPMRQS